MSAAGDTCDMITSPNYEGYDDVYCNRPAIVPFAGGGAECFVCLECAKSMEDDDDLIDARGRSVIAAIERMNAETARAIDAAREDEADWRLP